MTLTIGTGPFGNSKRAKLMHETGHLSVYYFPEEDVRMEFLEESDHTTPCPFKGDASYWSVKMGDRVAENAVWGYPDRLGSAPRRLRRVLLEQDRGRDTVTEHS